MPSVTFQERDAFVRSYVQGASVAEIAGVFRRSNETVWTHLRRGGVELRSVQEGVLGAVARGRMDHARNRVRKFDQALFERELTPESAWLLGLTFGDGNVRQQGRYLLACGVDEDLVAKTCAVLGADPAQCSFKKNNCWQIELSSKRLVASLARLGVRPAKTYTMQFPSIATELLPHFVRGLWEADGSMHVSGKRFYVKYASASRGFVESLEAVVALYVGARSKVCPPKRDACSTIQYSAASAAAIANWLYSSSRPEIRADRKHRLLASRGLV